MASGISECDLLMDRPSGFVTIKSMEEKRYRWLYETKVVMKNVVEVKLVIPKERINSRNCKFLVSSDTSMDGLKIFEYYKNVGVLKYFIGIVSSVCG